MTALVQWYKKYLFHVGVQLGYCCFVSVRQSLLQECDLRYYAVEHGPTVKIKVVVRIPTRKQGKAGESEGREMFDLSYQICLGLSRSFLFSGFQRRILSIFVVDLGDEISQKSLVWEGKRKREKS